MDDYSDPNVLARAAAIFSEHNSGTSFSAIGRRLGLSCTRFAQIARTYECLSENKLSLLNRLATPT